MDTLGVRLGIIAAVVTLTASACTGSGTDTPSAPAPAVEARWTPIAIGPSALPTADTLNASAGIGPADGLPMTLVGTVASPGEPTRPVVWHPRRRGRGEPQPLDVAASDAWPTSISQVGDQTYVIGTAWEDGTTRPFVQRSADRRTWQPVEIPDGVGERDVDLQSVIDDGAGAPLAVGASTTDAVVVDLASGEIRDLPEAGPGYATYGVVGGAVIGGSTVVLVSARDRSGQDHVVAIVSADTGRTWRAAGSLPGAQASAAGVVSTGDRLVVTGSRLVGDTRHAVAWSSADGREWHQEHVDLDSDPGWDTWLSAPAADARGVYVGAVRAETTSTTILRRTRGGRWEQHGVSVAGWRHPGTTPVVVPDGPDLTFARSENGDFQVVREQDVHGHLRIRISRSRSAAPSVAWWEAAHLDGDGIVLTAGRRLAEVYDPFGTDWKTTTRLGAFAIADGRLNRTTWNPGDGRGLTSLAVESAPDGSQVAIATRERHDRLSGDLRFTLEGWFQAPDGDWQQVRGLDVPNSADLDFLHHVDGRWVLAATDRADTHGGHSFGAVWTSRDGRRWRREPGPFDLGDGVDSWLDGSCRLPNGDLLAVGGRDDPRSSARALAFLQHDGRWKQHPLRALGTGVVDLDSCATAGDATVVTGWTLTQQHWLTSDGRTFESLEIGDDGDYVGEIVAVPHGFVAAGTQYSASRRRPVVWMSTDGKAWRAVPVPVERSFSTGILTVWGDRLVVALTSDSGPGVYVLENVADLLRRRRG